MKIVIKQERSSLPGKTNPKLRPSLETCTYGSKGSYFINGGTRTCKSAIHFIEHAGYGGFSWCPVKLSGFNPVRKLKYIIYEDNSYV